MGIPAAHAYDYKASPENRYDKSLWETEVSTIGDAYDGSITNGLYWANQIHSFLTYAEVNALALLVADFFPTPTMKD